MARKGTAERKTAETFVRVSLELDGEGSAEVATGVGFLDHLLHLLAHHSGMDLTVEAKGDTWVDDHHTVEDTGLVLGRAFDEALGERSGITRNLGPMPEKVGTFDVELFPEFLRAFTQYGRFTLHLNCHYGENAHHKLESGVKALAVALREGIAPRTSGSASTKGIID